jgi:hypothetical protein
MFPINHPTPFFITLTGVLLASALAGRLNWTWRIPLLAIALGLPALLLWFDPPTGEYAGLAYLIVIVPSAVLLLAGAGCGYAARQDHVAALKFVVVTVAGAGAFAGFLLWKQYVPPSCLQAPLQVRVADTVLTIPSELRPGIRYGSRFDSFGWPDDKSSTARLCRKGDNGMRVFEAETVSIATAANYDEITAACSRAEPPAWCDVYSPDAYRHVVEIRIAPESDQGFPHPYWDGNYPNKDRQGDLTEGSVCLVPGDGIETQCLSWMPFGNGYRLTVGTYSADKTFTDMPAEEARDIMIKASEMMLRMIMRLPHE